MPPVPAVDFDRQMVLAAYSGVQKTAGYAVDIAVRFRLPTGLRVSVKSTSPDERKFYPQVITAPYCFAVVDRTSEKVRFVFEAD